MSATEYEIVAMARRVLSGDANFEDDGIVAELDEVGDYSIQVLMWKDECGCTMGEVWAGDRLATCGKCFGYGRLFFGGATFDLRLENVDTTLPKEHRI